LSKVQGAVKKAQNTKNKFPVVCISISFFYSILPVLILFTLLNASFCLAGTPHEEYKKIQKQITTHKEKLDEAKKRESSILTEMENTNKQLKRVETDLKKYKTKLVDTESRILRVEYEISQNKNIIEKHREWIKRKLRAIHKYGYNSDIVMLFLSSDDISQLMRKVKYLQYLTVYEHRIMDNYKGNLETLSEKENQLVSLKKELTRNKEKVKAEEESLAQKKKHKEGLLASVKREETSYSKMLKELKNASQKILDIIRESEKSEKEEPFATKNFSGLKGKLPWPVEGKIAIHYGSQKDPQFNTPIFRSGTYIQSSADSLAKAVHSGKVVFAEWFKGYGQLVIVNHGDGYHTLYGSLSEIFTKVGDIIKGKQAIGRVGNSGLVNSPGLYFELRYKGKPLDPLQWLKRR
jgi:murein hydrolase activator